MSISREAEANITRILHDVRRESQTDSPSGVGSWQHSKQLQPSTSWSSNPGPSTSWGSQGACGVGLPGGHEGTDSMSSKSHFHHLDMDTVSMLVDVHIHVCECFELKLIAAVASSWQYTISWVCTILYAIIQMIFTCMCCKAVVIELLFWGV